MFLESIEVPRARLDYKETIRVIEDYKQLDVEAATMALALCRGIRQRYPDWKYLVDGDGGDENLKDYPIEENSGADDPQRPEQPDAVPGRLGCRHDQALADLFRRPEPRSRADLCAGARAADSRGSARTRCPT